MFRRVSLDESIPGKLYLTAMPGRYESIDEFRYRIDHLSIDRVVCLTSLEEVLEKSEDYYFLLTSGEYTWKLEYFPIPDFGVPDDKSSFLQLSMKMAESVKTGESIVVHCAAGIGRTGTFSMVLLLALGMDREDAADKILSADAQPEGIGQEFLIDWCIRELQNQ